MFGRSEKLSKSLQEILKERGKGSVGAWQVQEWQGGFEDEREILQSTTDNTTC